MEAGVLSPTGKSTWSRSTIRGIFKNPAYVGNAYVTAPSWLRRRPEDRRWNPWARALTTSGARRRSGSRLGAADRRRRDLRSGRRETLRNKKFASRNNKSHQYLLRALVSCGACGQGAGARTTWDGRSYYVCRGHHEIVAEQRCRARHAPGSRRDELVWKDLCEVLTHPEHVKYALRRAHGGEGMPQS
jgi:site-specific DNA recombinase